jgi:hypothetical protein
MEGPVRLVPAAADMLLLLAEKVQRRGAFTLRDFNDAQFMLVAEEGRIDWEELLRAARLYGIGGALHLLASQAEHRESRTLTPDGVLDSLMPSRTQRRMIETLAGREQGESAGGHGGAAAGAARRWRRSWFLGHVRRCLVHPRTLTRLMADVVRGSLFKLQFRMARRAMDRGLQRVGAHRPVVLGALPNPKASAHGIDDDGG